MKSSKGYGIVGPVRAHSGTLCYLVGFANEPEVEGFIRRKAL
jgi:hypothetical protein